MHTSARGALAPPELVGGGVVSHLGADRDPGPASARVRADAARESALRSLTMTSAGEEEGGARGRPALL